MSHYFTTISKTFALLAVVMLPVEQTLAASCCCRGSQIAGKHPTAGLLRSCCSQAGASCCSTASTSHNSCCDSDSNSDSKPCQCPVGFCGFDPPTGFDPGTNTTSSSDELRVDTLAAVPAITCDLNFRTPFQSLRLSAFHTSTSGSQRCVLLCRYRL